MPEMKDPQLAEALLNWMAQWEETDTPGERLQLLGLDKGDFYTLWSAIVTASIEIREGKLQEVTLDVLTAGIHLGMALERVRRGGEPDSD